MNRKKDTIYQINGVPTDVSLYHPIEFLGLDKKLLAYLDLGMEEFKGGFQNQLLVGHLVHFIQNKSLESLKKFPRYKDYYLDLLIEQCKERGLDLNNLNPISFNLDTEKLSTLSDATSIYQPNDNFSKASNIFSSSNYSMFHKLAFNRKVNKSHKRRLVESIRENGIISYPLMIQTDCIDGIMKYWIIDGQHRFEAFKELGLPIFFTLYKKQNNEPVTKYDIVRLIAKVNNTSRGWTIVQYLKAWESLDMAEYSVIRKVRERTKLPMNVILQAYSGFGRHKAIELFTDGKFQIADKGIGDQYIQNILDLNGIIPRNTAATSACISIFREIPNYDNHRMVELLKQSKGFVFGETQEDVFSNLKALYNNAA